MSQTKSWKTPQSWGERALWWIVEERVEEVPWRGVLQQLKQAKSRAWMCHQLTKLGERIKEGPSLGLVDLLWNPFQWETCHHQSSSWSHSMWSTQGLAMRCSRWRSGESLGNTLLLKCEGGGGAVWICNIYDFSHCHISARPQRKNSFRSQSSHLSMKSRAAAWVTPGPSKSWWTWQGASPMLNCPLKAASVTATRTSLRVSSVPSQTQSSLGWHLRPRIN